MSLNPPYIEDLVEDLVEDQRRRERDARESTGSADTNTSAAQLSLQRYFQQTLPGAQGKDAAKPGDPAVAGVSAKGKPRLLLMGQRR